MENLFKTSKDFTREDRDRLLEQYRGSGLAYQDFAREHNISGQTLKNWIWYDANPNVVRRHFTPVERKKTVETFLASGNKQDDFCKAWGISPPTLSKWLQRYEEFGSEGLMNKVPGPRDKRIGTKIPEVVQAEIINLKKKEPSFGLKKIRHWLIRFKGVKVSTGSIRKTVTSEGLPLAIDTLKTLALLKENDELPLVLATDNGSPFVSEVVEDFLAYNNVIHLKSLPRVPQQNGSAEATVGDIKYGKKHGMTVQESCFALNQHRLRSSLNWQTPAQAKQNNFTHYSSHQREVFYEATCSAINAALIGIKNAKEKRKAEREAIFQTLENFSLIVKTRGRRSNLAKAEEIT